MHEVAVTQSMPVAAIGGGLRCRSGSRRARVDHAVPFHWLPNTVGVLPVLNPRAERLAHRSSRRRRPRRATPSRSSRPGSPGWPGSSRAVPCHGERSLVGRPDGHAERRADAGHGHELVVGRRRDVGARSRLPRTVPFHCSTRVPPPEPLFCSRRPRRRWTTCRRRRPDGSSPVRRGRRRRSSRTSRRRSVGW